METLRIRESIAPVAYGKEKFEDPELMPNTHRLLEWLRGRSSLDVLYQDIARNGPKLPGGARPIKKILDDMLKTLAEYGLILWTLNSKVIHVVIEPEAGTPDEDTFEPFIPSVLPRPNIPERPVALGITDKTVKNPFLPGYKFDVLPSQEGILP